MGSTATDNGRTAGSSVGTGAILLGAFVFLLIALLIGMSRLDEQRRLLKGFDLEDVARIELSTGVVVSRHGAKWRVDSLYGYPANERFIKSKLRQLAALSVVETVQDAHGTGRRQPNYRDNYLEDTFSITLRDAGGKELCALTFGDFHYRYSQGWVESTRTPDGRYLFVSNRIVRVSDPLRMFAATEREWCPYYTGVIPLELREEIRDWKRSLRSIRRVVGDQVLEIVPDVKGKWIVKGLRKGETVEHDAVTWLFVNLQHMTYETVVCPVRDTTVPPVQDGGRITVTFDGEPFGEPVEVIVEDPSGERSSRMRLGDWVYRISPFMVQGLMVPRERLVKRRPAADRGRCAIIR